MSLLNPTLALARWKTSSQAIVISIISLLVINPFLPLLLLSGDVNPLSTVIAFFVILSFPAKNVSMQLIRSLTILMLFYSFFSVVSVWSAYSIIAWVQAPAYLFSFLYLFSSYERCYIFIRSLFKWLVILAGLSIPLFLIGLPIPGLLGSRDGIGARGGGIPLFASEPSALMPIIVFLLVLNVCLYLSKINLFYGLKRSTILAISLLYLICSGSGLVVTSILFLVLLFSSILGIKSIFYLICNNKIKLWLRPTFKIKLKHIFSYLLILLGCALLYNFSSRLINILMIFMSLDLTSLFLESSHRPAFFLASFFPNDFIALLLGHGASHWYGNYMDSILNTADLIGQSSGLGIVNSDRISVLRPPSTLAFSFYSFGITGILLLFLAYRIYFDAVLKKLKSSNIYLHASVVPVIVSGTVTLLVIPGLAFNPVNLLPPSVLILLFYQLSSDKPSIS